MGCTSSQDKPNHVRISKETDVIFKLDYHVSDEEVDEIITQYFLDVDETGNSAQNLAQNALIDDAQKKLNNLTKKK